MAQISKVETSLGIESLRRQSCGRPDRSRRARRVFIPLSATARRPAFDHTAKRGSASLSTSDVIEPKSGDASGDIHACLDLNAERLKNDRILKSADQRVRARANADGRVCRDAREVACQRASADPVGGTEDCPDHSTGALDPQIQPKPRDPRGVSLFGLAASRRKRAGQALARTNDHSDAAPAGASQGSRDDSGFLSLDRLREKREGKQPDNRKWQRTVPSTHHGPPVDHGYGRIRKTPTVNEFNKQAEALPYRHDVRRRRLGDRLQNFGGRSFPNGALASSLRPHGRSLHADFRVLLAKSANAWRV
jgi:hypothetical protein